MAVVEVTISEMMTAATAIANANEDFRQAAAALQAATENLAGTWEGEKHDEFVADMEARNSWYKSMADLVDGYVGMLKNSASRYGETDSEAASKI